MINEHKRALDAIVDVISIRNGGTAITNAYVVKSTEANVRGVDYLDVHGHISKPIFKTYDEADEYLNRSTSE